MDEGAKIRPYILKMLEYIETFKVLGCALDDGLTIDLILQSLPNTFSQFVQDFVKNNEKKTLLELLEEYEAIELGIKMFEALTLHNGLYVLDMDKRIFNLENKKAKHGDLNQTFLYHCRPGHVNQTRIAKIHNDGVLDPFDFQSYEWIKTLYELWNGWKPKLSYLRIWGYNAYVKKLTSNKLAPKSDKCIFVGYPRETMGYYFYQSEERKVFVAQSKHQFLALSNAAKEVVWIRKFITELGVVPSIVDLVQIFCDNNGVIAQAKEPRSHQRSKHILKRFHLIREIVQREDVQIIKVPIDDNILDPLTKALSQ
ncbi:uncharacterized protein LOC116128024 [Pistacia vera]|uniref:uncharacterized protein LOC116128024 n=1 Tax=Pistacia vera TaxID=55513 RepID=UPI001263100C|nr:uncharacterized protein LOC116128024 [Pistacia vera]